MPIISSVVCMLVLFVMSAGCGSGWSSMGTSVLLASKCQVHLSD